MSELKQRVNFGWVPDLPDFRDRLAFPNPGEVFQLLDSAPARLDLRERHAWKVQDQEYIGSCVAHAVGSAIEYAQRTRPNDPKMADFLEDKLKFPVSRLFLYYEARKAIGLTHEDSGCHIRDAMRVAYNVGVPRETGWGYRPEQFAVQPPKHSYKSAPFHKITSYATVRVDVQNIKAALLRGQPVAFGVSVYSSFYRAETTGIVPMPGWRDEYLGGHAMLIVGYDDRSERFTVLNSWGPSWGDAGYCYIPYDYAGSARFGSDYWVLTDEQYRERING